MEREREQPIDGARPEDRPWEPREEPQRSGGERRDDDDQAEGTREAVSDQPAETTEESGGRRNKPSF